MAHEKQRYFVCYDYGTGGLVRVLLARSEDKIARVCPGHRLSPTGNQEGQAMAGHPNVARIKNLYAAMAKSDLAALNDVFADDLVWHDCGRNQLSGDYRGGASSGTSARSRRSRRDRSTLTFIRSLPTMRTVSRC
jgi:hypothetical protein